MVDKIFTMNINEVLEIEYLVEEVSSDSSVTVKSGDSSDLGYISRNTGILNPSSTGTYELELNGQIIEVNVTNIIDDFEDGDLAEYTVNTSGFSVVDTPSLNGDFSLNANDNSSNPNIQSTNGLGFYPSVGDSWRYAYRFQDATDSIIQFWFFTESENAKPNGYEVRLDGRGGDNIELAKWYNSGSRTVLASETQTYESNTWNELEISVTTDNKITAELFDGSGTSIGGPISATDSTYTNGGLGFQHSPAFDTGDGIFIDYIRFV